MSLPEIFQRPQCRSVIFFAAAASFAVQPCTILAQQAVASAASGTDQPVVSQAPLETVPKPAQVTCDRDMLTITAKNSTLSNILAGIQRCLGVKIEMSEATAAERFYIDSGPAPVRDKLEELLSATGLNYVIEEGPSQPYRVQSILLMARGVNAADPASPHGGDLGHTMTPARRAWLVSREAARDGRTEDTEAQTHDVEAGPSETKPVEGVSLDTERPASSNSQAEDPGSAATTREKAGPVKDVGSPAVSVPIIAADRIVTANPPGTDTSAPSVEKASPAVPTATLTDSPEPAVLEPDNAHADSNQQPIPTPAPTEFQNKVDQMQKLFEQRKAMTPTPAPPPSE